MDWNQQLQEIIDYVEEHLQRTEEPINQEDITKIAGCSYGFFQKVFSYMNEMSFAEYIRNRKLTLAGYDLKSTRKKVVEISYKYGYDSPTSFTKAFSQFHGLSPKDARNEDAILRVYPKMQISLKQEYSWRLEKKEAIHLLCKMKRISCANGNNYKEIPEIWQEGFKDGTFAKLVSIDQGEPKGLFGLCLNFNDQLEEIDYAIAVQSNQDLEGFKSITLPAETWAVFDCRGRVPESIQNGWRYLNEEWEIKYPFNHANCPEVEWYSEGNSFDENYLSQIWIPIEEEN